MLSQNAAKLIRLGVDSARLDRIPTQPFRPSDSYVPHDDAKHMKIIGEIFFWG